jgi:hypothetical protein
VIRGCCHWRTASSSRVVRRDERSFEALLAFVDRLLYTAMVAFAACLASMLMR